jgi:hypothetical protein
MVHSMVTDRDGVLRVASFLALIACSPSVRPPLPPAEPGPVVRNELRPKPTKGGRQVVIGEMCPQGAAGRPAVAPLVMRTVAWNDAAADVQNVVERGGVPRFTVFGIDGKVAGVFETVGLADVGLQQSVASGTYVGAPPCSADAGVGNRTEDPKCVPATGGCGVAVGELGRPDDPPASAVFQTGGACLSGDALAVDIDGDGVMESFPLVGVLDGVRSPAAEWTAAPTAGAACKPSFQLYNVRLGPPAEPKQVVNLTLLGVVDVDGDGRKELVLALEFPTVRTIVVYTSTGSPQRLELAGEGTSFQK